MYVGAHRSMNINRNIYCS